MYCSHLKLKTPPRPPKTLTPQEAAKQIAELTLSLLPENLKERLSEVQLEFYTRKFILNCLDYIHSDRLPETLIYDVVELVIKRISEDTTSTFESSETTVMSSNIPVKRLSQDDTTWEFAVNNIDLSGLLSNKDFDTLKPKLNLYRQMISY